MSIPFRLSCLPRFAAFLSAFLLVLLSSLSHAHHSPSMFNTEVIREVSGVVEEFQWTNPHCYIQLSITTENGETETWSMEMGAPSYLYNNGWRPSTLSPGDEITVSMHPLLQEIRGGLVLQVTTRDGQDLGGSAL